jgi:hypothetical protein
MGIQMPSKFLINLSYYSMRDQYSFIDRGNPHLLLDSKMLNVQGGGYAISGQL